MQSALLLIADIGGYTRFMKFHAASLVHAQEIVGELLDAIIAAVRPGLKLAKLEGDAAFFYVPSAAAGDDPSWLLSRVEAIYATFHQRLAEFASTNLCPCDGCRQAGRLRIKVVAHSGDIVTRKTGGSTELTGVDVILVHRLLKNPVPLSEYFLLTQPVYSMLDPNSREHASPLDIDIDDLGRTAAWYLPLTMDKVAIPTMRVPMSARLRRHLRRIIQTVPKLLARGAAPCANFRNIPDLGVPDQSSRTTSEPR